MDREFWEDSINASIGAVLMAVLVGLAFFYIYDAAVP